MRIVLPLNYDWEYKQDFFECDCNNRGTDENFTLVDIPHIPKCLPTNYITENDYAHTHCYRKNIVINKKENQNYFFCFEGVAHVSTIYVNGQYVHTHYCGYTEFRVDITAYISDGQNLIVLKVEAEENEQIPPFGGVIDYATFGGIYREVSLLITEKVYIEDICIKTLDIIAKTISLVIKSKISTGVKIGVDILDSQSKCLISKTVTADEEVGIHITNENFELWSVDTPNLYTAKVTIFDESRIIDEVTEFFGIRTATFTKDGFFLNNIKVKLVGLNRHQIYPHVGYALPKQAQIDDANYLRFTLGLNIVRASHYPQSKHFLNRCDEIGLLVFEEMAGWQHIGESVWKDHYLSGLKEMILTHKNHPSIIMWGVRVNESADDDDFYSRSNELAHQLDDTRKTGGVRCSRNSSLLEDVYTYNDFSHNGKNPPIISKSTATKSNDSAYLIAEFNGHMFPTKSFDTQERLLEHALRHARIVNAYLGDDTICGGIGWSFSDYYTHQVFGGGDKICYHGVVDIFRNEKLAAYFYMSQHDNFPVIMPSSQMDFGEADKNFIAELYVFTNCDSIEINKNGYSLGHFYPDTKNFPHLKHPPIYIQNIAQNFFTEEDGFSAEKKKIALEFLNSAINDGGLHCISKETHSIIPSTEEQEKIWQIYIKNCMVFKPGLQDQGGFHFIGYKENTVVTMLEHIPYSHPILSVSVDRNVLYHNETYDVVKVTVKAMRSKSMVSKYCFDVLELTTSGGIEIIGDSLVSLISGMRSVWIRSKKEGTGKLTICSKRFSKINVDFKIEK